MDDFEKMSSLVSLTGDFVQPRWLGSRFPSTCIVSHDPERCDNVCENSRKNDSTQSLRTWVAFLPPKTSIYMAGASPDMNSFGVKSGF